MRSRSILATLVVVVSVCVSAIGRADPPVRSARYDLGLAAGVSASLPDPTGAMPDGTIEAGAVVFESIGGTGSAWIRISVQDDLSPSVGVTACHDFDGNGICAELSGDDSLVSGVLERDGWVEFSVRRDVPVTVTVGAAACIYFLGFLIPFPCGVGAATSGVVSMQLVD